MPQSAGLLEHIQTDDSIPALARELLIRQAAEFAQLQARFGEIDEKVRVWHQSDERSRRLSRIPDVGPVGAVMLALKTSGPELFGSTRHFAAWLGLTPKDHSTSGKTRLGTITRAGDEALPSVLVAGATSVLSHYRDKERHGTIVSWFNHLLSRNPPKLVAVALANKIARIAWKLMMSGEKYTKRMHARIARAIEVWPCTMTRQRKVLG